MQATPWRFTGAIPTQATTIPATVSAAGTTPRVANSSTAAITADGELRSGRVYNNVYHLLLEMRGGKIGAVREYYDTQHVHAVWLEE